MTSVPTSRALADEVLRLRIAQLIINERYKAGAFKIPLHIALGHEAIAVAADAVLGPHDRLICSHRNMHYNLARAKALRPILAEYLLQPDGLAGGELGSMNLANPERQIVYTSSILGNNLPVATGIALALMQRQTHGAAFVVTGDGAMEEGTMYESLLFAASNKLPLVIIVENNGWSMHTSIDERRAPIDIERLAGSMGAGYARLAANNVSAYSESLKEARTRALAGTPVVVEVMLTTLGGWHVEEGETKRFIHPHAGPLAKTSFLEWPVLAEDDTDPVHVLTATHPKAELEEQARTLAASLMNESI